MAECVDGVCVLDCQRGYADCNDRASDGCEANLLSDIENCGGCDQICAPDHAEGQCMNGQCLINTAASNQGCSSNYANCDLLPENGCEVELTVDPEHCGACEDAACSTANGDASCKAGNCGIECDDGYDDCDGDARANGCETRTSLSVNDCGECGNKCPSDGPDWYPFCKDGKCDQTQCDNGNGDCDGDGECTDPLDTTDNCGGCGILCSVQNGVPGCQEGACAVEECDASADTMWADCDQDYATGCEVNTFTNRVRCGGCLPTEGGTGQDCSQMEGTQHVTVTSCGAGECQIVSCDPGWVDCDGSFDNGCEVNTETDENNCGGCVDAGGDICVSKPHTASECDAGSCDYSCSVGWSDGNGDRYMDVSDGCEKPTLSLKNAGAFGSSDTGGAGPGVTVQHNLQGVAGTQRLVLVGVVCRGGSLANCVMTKATYGDIPLNHLDEGGDAFLTDTGVHIFYLLDKDLPGPGVYPVIIDRNDEWGSISVEVVEFSGAEQDTFFADAAVATKQANCDDGADATLQLTGLPPQSAIYAVGGGAHQSANASAKAIAPLTLSMSRADNFIVLGSGYAQRLGGDVSVRLDFNGCYRSVLYAVGIRPESNY